MADISPRLTFTDGNTIPQCGFGTWQSERGKVTEAVKWAIDAGYRHIDCARAYENEIEVGAGINAKIDEGVVKREDMFVTTKLWNTFHPTELVLPAMKDSLNRLGLEYVDLYMMHWPMGYKEGLGELYPKDENKKMLFSDSDYLDAWKGMEEAHSLGLAKSLGVCNFNSQQVERLLSVAKVRPVALQVECHPYLNQTKLIEFSKSKNLVFIAYSSLGAPQRPWVKSDDIRLLDDPTIQTIATKYNKTPAQILIRYQIERGLCVLAKSVTKSRIESNYNVFDFQLSDEDVKLINSLHRNIRFLHLNWVSDHKDFPFKMVE